MRTTMSLLEYRMGLGYVQLDPSLKPKPQPQTPAGPTPPQHQPQTMAQAIYPHLPSAERK
jgi:hypothetical protein